MSFHGVWGSRGLRTQVTPPSGSMILHDSVEITASGEPAPRILLTDRGGRRVLKRVKRR